MRYTFMSLEASAFTATTNESSIGNGEVDRTRGVGAEERYIGELVESIRLERSSFR